MKSKSKKKLTEMLHQELSKLNSRQLLFELVAISMRCATSDNTKQWTEIDDEKLYMLQKILVERLENGIDEKKS